MGSVADEYRLEPHAEKAVREALDRQDERRKARKEYQKRHKNK